MRRYFTRIAAGALVASVGIGGVTPCFAAGPAGGSTAPSLTRLSAATQSLLEKAGTTQPRLDRQPPAGGAESGSFLHTKRGAVAITLMAAGAGFAIWSVNHDRKPVKSPIR